MQHSYNVRCSTIEQFKILCWLDANGVSPCYVQKIEMLSGNRVKVVNPCGGYLIVICDGGKVIIDQTPE